MQCRMVCGVVLCDFIAEAQVVVSLKNDCDALPWGKEETDIEPGIVCCGSTTQACL